MINWSKCCWRDEANTEKLKQLWAEGLSCSQIAERMGLGLTRNAIIGRVHRLGLPKRDPNQFNRTPRKPSKPREPRTKNHHWRKQKFGRGPQATPKGPGERSSPFDLPAPPLEPIDLLPAMTDPEPHELVALADLESHHCRFPLDGKFCGRPTVDRNGGSYCAAHAARCFQGAPSKLYVSKFHTEGPKQKEQAA